MKTISLTLDNFDFIVNAFHTTGMSRKLAMIDNPIGISLKSFGKSHYRSYLAFFIKSTHCEKQRRW